MGASVLAGVALARPVLGAGLRRWAATQGVTLTFEQLGLEAGQLTLENVTVSAQALEGVQATSTRATFHVKHFLPEQLHLQNPRVQFSGTCQQALQLLARWRRGEVSPISFPVSATELELVARSPNEDTPWLETTTSIHPRPDGTLLDVRSLRTRGVSLGAARLLWHEVPEGFALELGQEPDAPFRAVLLSQTPTLRVEARRFPLRPVASALGLPAPPGKVEAEGKVEVSLLPGQTLDGKLSLTLFGYTPPHPPEVSSLVASDRTSIQADFHLDPGKESMTVAPITVSTGKLALRGSGGASLLSGRPTFKGTLNGSLPCNAVVGSAARSGLGGLLGGLVGDLADATLQGNILVSVQINADSRNVAAASFHPTFTPRCNVAL